MPIIQLWCPTDGSHQLVGGEVHGDGDQFFDDEAEPVYGGPFVGDGVDAPQHHLIDQAHVAGQTVTAALLGGHCVEPEVLLLVEVDLLALPADLEGEGVEDDLVEHHPEAEDVGLLAVLVGLDLLGRGVGHGAAPLELLGVAVELDGLVAAHALAEVDDAEEEGGLDLVAHHLDEHVGGLDVVVVDAVVAQEADAHCDLVEEEELGGEGGELAVHVQVGVHRLQRTVLVQDRPRVRRVLRVEVPRHEDRLGPAEQSQNGGLVDVAAVLGGLGHQVDLRALGVLRPAGPHLLHADVAPPRRGQGLVLDYLLHLDGRVDGVLALEPLHHQLLPQLLLGLARQFLGLALALHPHRLGGAEQFEGLGDGLGEGVGVVVVGLDLAVEVAFLLGVVLLGEGLRPHPLGLVPEGVAVEHEGVLDVALLQVPQQLAHLLLLLRVLLLLVELPVGVPAGLGLPHPQQAEQARQGHPPHPLVVLELQLHLLAEVVGGLADLAVDVAEGVVDDLVVELARLGVDGHGAEGELGVQVEGDEAVEDVELVGRKHQHLVQSQRVRHHLDVLQAQVELNAEHQGDAGVLGGGRGRERRLVPLVRVRALALRHEHCVLEGLLDGTGEGQAGEVVEAVGGGLLVGVVLEVEAGDLFDEGAGLVFDGTGGVVVQPVHCYKCFQNIAAVTTIIAHSLNITNHRQGA